MRLPGSHVFIVSRQRAAAANATVTLSQGIEVAITQAVPEIENVVPSETVCAAETSFLNEVGESPPWALGGEPAPLPQTLTYARAFTSRRPARWSREHDEIVAAVRELAWDGYFALVGDIFRREGYEVFGGEGPDGDVIDMEVVRGAERMLVNVCWKYWIPLFSVLDGKDSRMYVARVEPSVAGGEAMASAILDEVLRFL